MYAGKTTRCIYGRVNGPAYFNTQLQILTSPGLLRRVVKTLELEHNRGFLKPQSAQPHSTWKTIMQMWGVRGPDQKDESKQPKELPLTASMAPATSSEDLAEAKRLAPYVAALQGGLKVDPVRESRGGLYKETRLTEIRFQHSEPETAAHI